MTCLASAESAARRMPTERCRCRMISMRLLGRLKCIREANGLRFAPAGCAQDEGAHPACAKRQAERVPSMKTILGMNGACGRMGQRILQLVHEDKTLAI